MLVTFLETKRISDSFTSKLCKKGETYELPDTSARMAIRDGVAFEPRARADGFKPNRYFDKDWLAIYSQNAPGFLYAFDFIQNSNISVAAKDEITELYLRELLSAPLKRNEA